MSAPDVKTPERAPAWSQPGNGLLWGKDFYTTGPRDIAIDTPRADGVFRWLHMSLADNGARQWIERADFLPQNVREAMLAPDTHQSSFVEGETLSCVLQDLQRDFEIRYTDRAGTVHVAITPDMIITARMHPLGFADVLRDRFAEELFIDSAQRALDVLVSAIVANQAALVTQLSARVQKAEDAVLAGKAPPSARDLLELRRRLSIIHRMMDGTKRVLMRLEEDDDLDAALHPTVEKLTQRAQGLDEDVTAAQGQVRMLREELELAANQRINRNLYILSVMTVLLMPATLVTGFFGMNTGALPFAHGSGTWVAGGVALLASLATYVTLHWRGFFR